MITHRLLVVVLSLLCCTSKLSAHNSTLVFKDHGKVVATFSLDKLKTKLSPTDLTIVEPNVSAERTYRGFDFNKLMSKVYGPSWLKAEEVLFTCLDGYQPSVPLQEFKNHHAHLAFGAANGDDFKIKTHQTNEELVDLGPFYLTWDNSKNEALKAEGATFWPYQVVSIDLITFNERFPKIAPPPGAGHDATAGFLVFRKHCMSCHSVNGEGGTVSGIDLNFPVNVTEYYQAAWLPKWIADPQSIRPKTAMPPIPKDIAQREQKIRQIIAYLKAMKNKKIKPSSATAP